MNAQTEVRQVEILVFQGYLKVGLFYRPPDQTLEACLEMDKEIREVSKADNAVILCDFNCSHIDWVNLHLSHPSPRGHK